MKMPLVIGCHLARGVIRAATERGRGLAVDDACHAPKVEKTIAIYAHLNKQIARQLSSKARQRRADGLAAGIGPALNSWTGLPKTHKGVHETTAATIAAASLLVCC